MALIKLAINALIIKRRVPSSLTRIVHLVIWKDRKFSYKKTIVQGVPDKTFNTYTAFNFRFLLII